MEEKGWYVDGSAAPDVRPERGGRPEEARRSERWQQEPVPAERREPVVRYRLSARAILVVSVLLVAVGYGYTWLQFQVTARGYELERLESELVEAQRMNARLEEQLREARSLARVERVAREQLGMVDEPVIQFVPETQGGR